MTSTATNHKQLIIDLLDKNNIEYRAMQHDETPTSEDSARARGEDLSIGGKALVLKYKEPQEEDTGFAIFILSASRKLHKSQLRKS